MPPVLHCAWSATAVRSRRPCIQTRGPRRRRGSRPDQPLPTAALPRPVIRVPCTLGRDFVQRRQHRLPRRKLDYALAQEYFLGGCRKQIVNAKPGKSIRSPIRVNGGGGSQASILKGSRRP